MLKEPNLSEEIYNEISKQIEGDVFIDDISRLLWSTDASIYQIKPTAVVLPKNIEDVVALARYCWSKNIPLHPRGAGSGLGGASIGEGIIVDFTRYMDCIIEVNENEKYFRSQPGVRLSNIQNELKTFNLFLPPDPSSADYCVIGGNIGTNAGGAHSVKYGLMSDYTLSLKVVLANGELITTRAFRLDDPDYLNLKSKDTLEAEIYRNIEKLCIENSETIADGYPAVKFNVTGYDLREIVCDGQINITRLFVGSEGSLGIIVEVLMRVIETPSHTILMVAYFSDAKGMAKATWEALQEKPSAVEVLDHTLIDIAKEANPELTNSIPKELRYLLMIEFDGNDENALETQAKAVEKRVTVDNNLAFHTEIATSKEDQDRLWEVRKTGLPLLGKINDNGRKSVPVIEDAAVPPETLPSYLEELYDLIEEYDVPLAIYGHAGKGLLHTRPFLDLQKPSDIKAMQEISRRSFEKVKELDGTVSGEHGDGRVRGQYIREQYGE
ncbi:MAG: FAD-binding oxidoreductase, partial [Candidatus Kariarchaeaceae archaeon]